MTRRLARLRLTATQGAEGEATGGAQQSGEAVVGDPSSLCGP